MRLTGTALLAVLISVAPVVASCGATGDGRSGAVIYLVQYRVEGTGTVQSAHISYFDSDGKMEITMHNDLPWERTVRLRNNDQAALDAQGIGQGRIGCRIRVGGDIVAVRQSPEGKDPKVICV